MKLDRRRGIYHEGSSIESMRVTICNCLCNVKCCAAVRNNFVYNLQYVYNVADVSDWAIVLESNDDGDILRR
jgi:hypothetical protein